VDTEHVGPSNVYEAFRKQIEAEDGLIGTRVGWFIASEAFLFAAYGAVLAIQTNHPLPGTIPVDHRLFDAVPIVGVVMAVLVGCGIGAAMHRLRVLNKSYDKTQHPTGYPTVWANEVIVLLGHVTAASVAPVVILSWIFVWQGTTAFWLSVPTVGLLIAVFVSLHLWLAGKEACKALHRSPDPGCRHCETLHEEEASSHALITDPRPTPVSV
jgi:hypothetical protein